MTTSRFVLSPTYLQLLNLIANPRIATGEERDQYVADLLKLEDAFTHDLNYIHEINFDRKDNEHSRDFIAELKITYSKLQETKKNIEDIKTKIFFCTNVLSKEKQTNYRTKLMNWLNKAVVQIDETLPIVEKTILNAYGQELPVRPNTITLRVWYTSPEEERAQIAGMSSDGHASLDICDKAGNRKYISFLPADEEPSIKANFFSRTFSKILHIPKNDSYLGINEDPLGDTMSYLDPDDKGKYYYHEYKEIIFDCSQTNGLNIDTVMEWAQSVQNKLHKYDNAKKEIVDPVDKEKILFNFYSENCSSLVLAGLKAAESERLVPFDSFRSLTYVVTPEHLLRYGHALNKQILLKNSETEWHAHVYANEQEKVQALLELTLKKIDCITLIREIQIGNQKENNKEITDDAFYKDLKALRQRIETYFEMAKLIQDSSIYKLADEMIVFLNDKTNEFKLNYESKENDLKELTDDVAVILNLTKNYFSSKIGFVNQLNLRVANQREKNNKTKKIVSGSSLRQIFDDSQNKLLNIKFTELLDKFQLDKPFFTKAVAIQDAIKWHMEQMKSLAIQFEQASRAKTLTEAKANEINKLVIMLRKNIYFLRGLRGDINQQLFFNHPVTELNEKDHMLTPLKTLFGVDKPVSEVLDVIQAGIENLKTANNFKDTLNLPDNFYKKMYLIDKVKQASRPSAWKFWRRKERIAFDDMYYQVKLLAINQGYAKGDFSTIQYLALLKNLIIGMPVKSRGTLESYISQFKLTYANKVEAYKQDNSLQSDLKELGQTYARELRKIISTQQPGRLNKISKKALEVTKEDATTLVDQACEAESVIYRKVMRI